MFTEQPCVKKPMKYDNPFTRVILQITVYVLGMKNHQTKFYVTKRPMFFPRFSIIVKYLLRHWTDWLWLTNRANIIFFLNNKGETCCYPSNKVSIYHLQFTPERWRVEVRLNKYWMPYLNIKNNNLNIKYNNNKLLWFIQRYGRPLGTIW